MPLLVGRRTGVLVDTDGLPQDGIFDDIEAFWKAARPYDEKAVGALVHDDAATSSKDDQPGHRCQLAVLPNVGEAPADDLELYEPIAFSPTERSEVVVDVTADVKAWHAANGLEPEQ